MFHHLPRIGDRVDRLLDVLWGARGTDLMLTVGLPPMIRVDGTLKPIPDQPVLAADDTDSLLAEVLTTEQRDVWESSHEYDFSFSWREHARIRGNAFTQRGMTAVALRMIPRTVPTPDALGLPTVLRDLSMRHQGLILMTGPTGSGKSTTLASLIDLINTNRGCHIITVEDPIEYVHDHKMAAVNQREVGTDTGSFHNALRSVLREDPDVLLVGEMRDLESIGFALTVAETGHLVFATLHTNDTAQSLGRMIDVFPAEQQAQIRVQLAAALSCVVYQRLIPRIGGGMIASYEVLVATPAVRNLIKEGKTHQLRNSIVTGAQDGMVTLEQSLSQLIQAGIVTEQDAVARSLYPKDIDARPRHAVGVGR
ncbi:type IV pilus twitching motility protein PilT [Pimelobacter simplex]|uniref:Twitching motility protein PilT n=1 Tax=Nocardioides simplex TaxID=2045 RepID=A0A0A1DWK6_NOCSI|nr:type IV pilus twitching motility protein PilT [Pimelobacter simplex]AIY19835.2 Twitching motility protein PilT [Pimelobacter simplex]GEB12874.1 twitching motility protein PilT [Pimelobacter simplex]SFM52945.1 twitching motility protein PilT [Pimelobacter simplex]